MNDDENTNTLVIYSVIQLTILSAELKNSV